MSSTTPPNPATKPSAGLSPNAAAPGRLPRLSLSAALAGVVLMAAAAGTAWFATPRLQAVTGAPLLDTVVPKAFGEWRMIADAATQVDVAQGVETDLEQPYDQTVMRTYVNSQGEQVMVALAWGERQRQDVKVHRPEVCYPAQGFAVRRLEDGRPIATQGRATPVPTTQLLTEARGGGYEAVRYWIRIGEQYGGDGLKARWYILNEGLAGRIPDGVLVRASQRLGRPEQQAASQAVMERFLAELVAAVPAGPRTLLVR